MAERTTRDEVTEATVRGGTKMTLRVYSVDTDGAITNDSGTRHVDSLGVELSTVSAFPACSCPSCRRKRAAT